jgi:hypothetical protein
MIVKLKPLILNLALHLHLPKPMWPTNKKSLETSVLENGLLRCVVSLEYQYRIHVCFV